MATYAIGDIQGCYLAFLQILQIINFRRGHDRLLLLGDLVNRGKESLAMLRHVYAWRDDIDIILGNHDLYLLIIAAKLQQAKAEDTLEEIMLADDNEILLSWLRQQPLCRQLQVGKRRFTAVHAGLLPQWTASQAIQLSAEISEQLQSANYKDFLRKLWSSSSDLWHDGILPPIRWQIIVNAMTRMRFCSKSGQIDFKNKGGINSSSAEYLPWFEYQRRIENEEILLTGHWSALGLRRSNNHFSLDTAYLWGGQLTALRLDDFVIFQVQCPKNDGLAID